jgi:hypothetical protein
VITINQATRQYKIWLAGHTKVLKVDLEAKDQHMAADAFSFLRATFYRWAQLYQALCPELARAPKVLGVGDLHVENYGTWRDTEGRLVWGINDFDEACPLPYANDLVRLAVSARLAIEMEHMDMRPGTVCAEILEGYTQGLKDGGRPFVLSERHVWLRDAVTSILREPKLFWGRLDALPTLRTVPGRVRTMLKEALPEAGLDFRVVHRQAGLGSLGRQRYTAIAEWNGGLIAREAKTLLPSAWWPIEKINDTQRIYYNELTSCAVRAADPFLLMREGWIIRRLAPYCSRIELSQMPGGGGKEKLLWAMGYELANTHLGTSGATARVCSDLGRRKPKWLRQATDIMFGATLKEWKEWRKHYTAPLLA